MGNHSLPMLMTIAVVFMVGMMTSLAEAQTADCAQKLVPCASYINATKPPDSCCTPIKEAVATQLPCLCGLYTTPGVLKSFGITVEQALNLTRNCGINSDISKCNASAPSPTGFVSPPGVTTGSGNGGGRIAWAGFSTLFFFLASMMFY